MKTQLFKARDMKTAMNLVNDEYGDKAIILSTKRNNGVVEVEASDNDKVIETHKKKVEEKRNFSKVFNKSISTISRAIATLSDNGFIHTKLIKDDNNEIVERKIFLKETMPIPMGKNAHTPISKNDHRGIRKNAQYNNTSKNNTSINKEKINKKEKLVIPTIEKIDEHMNQYITGKGLQVNTMSDAESFFMYYESNGWYVGKNKMKCWKSAATGWVSRKYIQKNAYSYNVKQEPKKEKEINQLREIYDRI